MYSYLAQHRDVYKRQFLRRFQYTSCFIGRCSGIPSRHRTRIQRRNPPRRQVAVCLRRSDCTPVSYTHLLPGTNIFHSTELFHVFEMTRGYEPLLIVAYIGNRPCLLYTSTELHRLWLDFCGVVLTLFRSGLCLLYTSRCV